MSVKPGELYRHYKGNIYEVICTAVDSETLEEKIVYKDVKNPEKIWVRPAYMWNEIVKTPDGEKERFSLIVK